MKQFSPTTATAWVRLVIALVLVGHVMYSYFASQSRGAAIEAAVAINIGAAIAMFLGLDKFLGIVESKFTADIKDVEKLEKKIDQ